MAGDCAARIFSRQTDLPAEDGHQRLVDVGRRDSPAPEHKEEVNQLASLFIHGRRLLGARCFPSQDRFTHDLVHGLGERLAGLVDRDVKVAHGLGSFGGSVPLFPCAADAQPPDLIDAKPAKQPDHRQRLDHRQRVEMVSVVARNDVRLEVGRDFDAATLRKLLRALEQA